MNKIKVIIICLIAIVATCAFCIGLIAMSEQTTTVKLSETCSIDVKGEFETVHENGLNQIKIYDKFNNKEYKSKIVYSGANAGTQEVVAFGMVKMAFVGDTWDNGAEPVKTQVNNETVYVIYTGNNITHDNILIISENRDDCIKMYNSIKYNTNGSKKLINNTTIVKEEINYNIEVKDSQQSEHDKKVEQIKQQRDAQKGKGELGGMSDEQIERGVSDQENGIVRDKGTGEIIGYR